MKTLIKFPTRSRPEIFKRTLARWQSDPTVHFLITIDDDDPTCCNEPFINWVNCQPNLDYDISSSKSKIEAINHGVVAAKWDLLILAADDMIPQFPDYGQRIQALFKQWFPHGDGVLHLDDGRARSSLNTLPIIDRQYFNRFGYIYHPDYVSLWADNEFTDVSRSKGCVVYQPQCIIKHEWKDLIGEDELFKRNDSFFDADKKVYETRRAAGFPLNSVLSGKETQYVTDSRS